MFMYEVKTKWEVPHLHSQGNGQGTKYLEVLLLPQFSLKNDENMP